MPAWGMHLYIAKKINEKINIKDYDSFLFGNIVADINNGYLVKDVSKIINHKQTHYYVENEKNMNYDIQQFIKDNKNNLESSLILGYIAHLFADQYWNNTTYTKYGIYNEQNKLIGLKLNDGNKIINAGEKLTKIKQDDFRVFVNYLYKNNLVDIPVYNEKIYEQIKNVKSIELTKEDINKTINYLDKVKNGLELHCTDYKIFTQEEMHKNIDICVDKIINYLETNNINL